MEYEYYDYEFPPEAEVFGRQTEYGPTVKELMVWEPDDII